MGEDITIVELVDSFKKFIRYCWKNKLWIILIGLIGSLFGFWIAINSKPEYSASISFMVKEDESNSSFSGIASILGSFGLGGSKTKFNLDKVVALSKSENIVRKALLDTMIVGKNRELIAENLIDVYNLLDEWKTKTGPISQFKKITNIHTFSLEENSALSSLYSLIANSKNKNNLLSSSFDKDNTIITLKVASISDTLSYSLVNSIFKNLQEFYVFQSTQKARITVENLERKVAKVENKLQNKEYSLAAEEDQTLGIWNNKARVPQQRINRDVQINSIMYGELIKNLESARFALENSFPVFQVIDEPYFPVSVTSESITKKTIYGFLIAGIISILFFFLRFMYEEAKK